VGIIVQLVRRGIIMSSLLVDKVLIDVCLAHLRDPSTSGGTRRKSFGVVKTATLGKASKKRSWFVLTKLSSWLQTTFLVINKIPPCFGLVVQFAPTFQDFLGSLGQEDVLLPAHRKVAQESSQTGVGTPNRILWILNNNKKEFVIAQNSIRTQAKLDRFVVDNPSVKFVLHATFQRTSGDDIKRKMTFSNLNNLQT